MSVRYVTVQWNRRKLAVDAVGIAGIAAYVWVFRAVARATLHGREAITGAILDMRAWGSCAFLMLTIILCIGPLARLDHRFAPLLYNRRHLGVLMCGVALFHAWQVLGYYHVYGGVPASISALTHDTALTTSPVPFPVLGMLALAIVTVMAATSHDFWQRFLGPGAWKSLHMAVYAAYALAVGHVAYGALQREIASSVPAILVLGSAVLVTTLHVVAALRARDRQVASVIELDGEPWLDAGALDRLREDRATAVIPPEGERIALVRTKDTVSAVHGLCAHQGGPLYEGRVVDGCLTCPWHGWQYRPHDGCSPPPFQERLPTHPVRLIDGRVLVRMRAAAPGRAEPPARIEEPAS